MLTASLTRLKNHIKFEESITKFGVKQVKVGFLPIDNPADADEVLKEIEANIASFALGAAFTAVKKIAGEDVATGKLYEVVIS